LPINMHYIALGLFVGISLREMSLRLAQRDGRGGSFPGHVIAGLQIYPAQLRLVLPLHLAERDAYFEMPTKKPGCSRATGLFVVVKSSGSA